jgi:hypothetical protein
MVDPRPPSRIAVHPCWALGRATMGRPRGWRTRGLPALAPIPNVHPCYSKFLLPPVVALRREVAQNSVIKDGVAMVPITTHPAVGAVSRLGAPAMDRGLVSVRILLHLSATATAPMSR